MKNPLFYLLMGRTIGSPNRRRISPALYWQPPTAVITSRSTRNAPMCNFFLRPAKPMACRLCGKGRPNHLGVRFHDLCFPAARHPACSNRHRESAVLACLWHQNAGSLAINTKKSLFLHFFVTKVCIKLKNRGCGCSTVLLYSG